MTARAKVTPSSLVDALGEDRVLVVDADDYGALAGGLATLLADAVDVGWFSVRYWGGTTLVIELGGVQIEAPLPDGDALDVRSVAVVFARAAGAGSARLVVVRTPEGDAVVRFDSASAIQSAMDLPVRCPTCKAEFEARRLWAEELATCAYCGAELIVPEVLAAFVDEAMPIDAQLNAFPEGAEPPAPDEVTDERALERALSEALDLLGPYEDDVPRRAGELLTDDTRRLLTQLGIAVPADDAPPDAIERALAAARLALVRLDTEEKRRPSADALVDAVGTIDPQSLIDEEPTDPSLYLDELPPLKDDERH